MDDDQTLRPESESDPFLAWIDLVWPGLPRSSDRFRLAREAFRAGRLVQADPAFFQAYLEEERRKAVADAKP
jgi:hypothetical protein